MTLPMPADQPVPDVVRERTKPHPRIAGVRVDHALIATLVALNPILSPTPSPSDPPMEENDNG